MTTHAPTTKGSGHDKNIAAVLELLAEKWPAAFSIYENRRRPLKIGIHLDILAALDGAISAPELSVALRVYVLNRVYRSRLVAGAVRVGLAGKSAGIVTAEQIPLQKTPTKKPPPKKTAPKKTAPAVAAPPLSAPTPAPASGPARISLADLRRAAQLRKVREAAA